MFKELKYIQLNYKDLALSPRKFRFDNLIKKNNETEIAMQWVNKDKKSKLMVIILHTS